MTQNDPTSLRDELLKQARTGNEAIDAGLARLRQLVENEQARVRRLSRWTRIVWIAAALSLLGVVTSFFGYLVLSQKGSPTPPRFIEQILGIVLPILFFAGVPILLVCIVVGIVLLVMSILARRTAGIQEMRASLASIDAQLRVLALADSAKQVRPPG